MARLLESPAGSESVARLEMEASRNLGDPAWSSGGVGSVGSTPTQEAHPKARRMLRWKSDSLIVLGARESRVHGEAVSRAIFLVGETWSSLRGRTP